MLRYTEPDQAQTWKRMTLYRSTDAADTMNMAAMLIAAYCEHTGMAADTLRQAQRPEDDPQKLFTEACLHGLRARLCDDVESLDSYLPHVATLCPSKVTSALFTGTPSQPAGN
ncbi:hypothetical protein ABZ322_27875 [Streptomyces sp. NPDC006129]|uniref:hypothetical protein n=1 Tax=Streptomyces sp. NPDC006129 TaxID=3155348 RepID=UPI0033B5FD66